MASNPKKGTKRLELLEDLFKHKWTAEGWAMEAQILKRASDVLFAAHKASTTVDGKPTGEVEDTMLNKPATLLYGYAMENAIKANLIKKFGLNEKSLSSWKKENHWKSHNLRSLIAETDVSATEEQILLLDSLTAAVNWAGKYPTSFSFQGQKNPFVMPKQYDYATGVCEDMPASPLDMSTIQKLNPVFQRLVDGI